MNKFRPSKSVDGLPQSATGVEQGGPDSLNHNSEKSGVGGLVVNFLLKMNCLSSVFYKDG